MENHCHTHKKSWFLPLVVALGILAFAGFRYFNIFAVYPLAFLILCPLIHGGMFYFLGKGLMSQGQPEKKTDTVEERP